DEAQARIDARDLRDDCYGFVRAAVIDEHHLEWTAELTHGLHDRGVERTHALLLVEERHDDGDRRSSAARLAAAARCLNVGCNYCRAHPQLPDVLTTPPIFADSSGSHASLDSRAFASR